MSRFLWFTVYIGSSRKDEKQNQYIVTSTPLQQTVVLVLDINVAQHNTDDQ